MLFERSYCRYKGTTRTLKKGRPLIYKTIYPQTTNKHKNLSSFTSKINRCTNLFKRIFPPQHHHQTSEQVPQSIFHLLLLSWRQCFYKPGRDGPAHGGAQRQEGREPPDDELSLCVRRYDCGKAHGQQAGGEDVGVGVGGRSFGFVG